MKFSIILCLFCSFLHFTSNAQAGQYPFNIGKSNNTTININNPKGKALQNVKRAIGAQFITAVSDNNTNPNSISQVSMYCSCVLVNNTQQNKKPYVLLSNHCIDNDWFENTTIGTEIEGFMTFDYEISDAYDKGSRTEDVEISNIYKVKYRVKVKNQDFDLALVELIEYDTKLLEYVYAAGWDNTLKQGKITDMSAHPGQDHKKVYTTIPHLDRISYIANENESTTRPAVKGYQNSLFTEQSEEGGCCGGPTFTSEQLVSNIYSGNKLRQTTSAISNAWYRLPSEERRAFMTFLDPNNSWLNKIPGGYLNDMIEIPNQENLVLELSPAGSSDENDMVETTFDTHQIRGSVLYDFVNYDRDFDKGFDHEPPTWTDFHGILIENIDDLGPNDHVVLSVWYLEEEINEERLLYGVYANGDSEIFVPKHYFNIDDLGDWNFRADSWDCNNPPTTDFPPCNRLNVDGKQGLSTESRADYIKYLNFDEEDIIMTLLESDYPIKIRLQNLGSVPVRIKAIRYPGDVPKNALQLFKPNEIWNKFKSFNYPKSKLKGGDELNITSIEIHQDDYQRTIKTSDNGGYLNLVNPNYKIGTLKLSTTDVSKNMDLKIKLNNPEDKNYSYKVWIDYDKAKDDTNYTYNFNEAATVTELIASGNENGMEINLNNNDITLPTADDLGLTLDETYNTRMRISVVQGDTTPVEGLDDDTLLGEVEDYLISFTEASCENEKPIAYKTYAEKKLPYCGEGGYKKIKEALSLGLETEPSSADGSITFQTGKIENIPYATAWGPHYAFYGRKQSALNWQLSSGNETLRVNAIPEVNESQTVGLDPSFLKNHQLYMDIYYPESKPDEGQQALPVVIWMHGGGFMIHDKPEQSEKVCQWLASKGYIVASIDYRLGINLTNGELAKRAMIRAWQDMTAAIKYWRHKNIRNFTNTSEMPVDLNINFNKIYGLGWDAGAITVLNNIYLTDAIYNSEQAEGKSLVSTASNYQYTIPTATIVDDVIPKADALYLDGLDGLDSYISLASGLDLETTNNMFSLYDTNALRNLYNGLIDQDIYNTYSLNNYPTLPCIGDHQNCNSNFPVTSDYSALIDELDGRADKAVAFSGAMHKTWFLKSELFRPVATIHHKDDKIIDYAAGKPFTSNYLNEFKDLYNYSFNGPDNSFLLSLEGSNNLNSYNYNNHNINFELNKLLEANQGGTSKHNSIQKFNSTDDDNDIEDQLMYFVDAFFIKNTGTNSSPEPSFCQETTITRPDYLEYQAYAEPNIMPYCDYVAEKVILADSYQETSPGSLTFGVGKVEDIPYATTWAPHYGFYGKYRSEINYLWNTSGAYDLTYSEVLLPAMNESSQIGANPDFIKNGELLMDVYYPKVKGSITTSIDLNEELPVIIWAFGGGFIKHDKPEMSENICNWLASKGYIVAKIDYRLGLNITDGELSKRAATKALQDIKAAIQYWRHTDSDDNTPNGFYKNGDHIWKVDKDKIYGLGWSAGGITVLNNLYLTDSAYNAEVGTGNYLESSGGSYNFSVSQTSLLQSNQAALSFYDYVAGSPYPSSVPIPDTWTQLGQTAMVSIALWNLPPQAKSVLQGLIALNNINTLYNSNNSLNYTTYSLADYPSVPRILNNQNGLDNLPAETVTKLQNINSNNYDSRFDKGISFAGGIPKIDWMNNETNRPISSIYHIDDRIINKETDVPFNDLYNVNANQNIYNTIFQNDLSKPLPPLNGGKAMYDYAFSNGFTNFHHIDLSGSDKGGISKDFTGIFDTKHEPMVVFNATNLNKDKVEPKIMYYVDAFFMKDWGTAIPKSAPHSGKGSNTNLVTEPIDQPDFSLYPIPASDKLNILVEVRQEGPLYIDIYDMNGRQVYSINRPKISQGHQLINLPVQNLSAGNYIIRIRAGDVLRSEQILIK